MGLGKDVPARIPEGGTEEATGAVARRRLQCLAEPTSGRPLVATHLSGPPRGRRGQVHPEAIAPPPSPSFSLVASPAREGGDRRRRLGPGCGRPAGVDRKAEWRRPGRDSRRDHLQPGRCRDRPLRPAELGHRWIRAGRGDVHPTDTRPDEYAEEPLLPARARPPPPDRNL